MELLAHDDPHLDPVRAHEVEQQLVLLGEPLEAELVLRPLPQELGHCRDDATIEELDGATPFTGGRSLGWSARQRGGKNDRGPNDACDEKSQFR